MGGQESVNILRKIRRFWNFFKRLSPVLSEPHPLAPTFKRRYVVKVNGGDTDERSKRREEDGKRAKH